jgi:formylglycine-generating enzyme required for sulfatase activity
MSFSVAVLCFALSFIAFPIDSAQAKEMPLFFPSEQRAEASVGGSSPLNRASFSGCHCQLDTFVLLAANTHPMPEETTADSRNDILAKRIRQIAEMMASGDTERAKTRMERLVDDCEQGIGDAAGCAQWSEAMNGLNKLLAAAQPMKTMTNSLGMRMIRIPAGEYMMGSLKREMDWLRLTFKKIWREGHKQWFQDELPLHPVRMTKPYYMSATEVTVGQFRKFVEATKYKTDAERGDGGMIFSKKEGRWVPRKKMKWSSLPWQTSDDQPVVFVSWNDAEAFCKWLSRKEKRTYRLPTEAQWERGCRGGSVWSRYPWGDRLPGDRDANFGDGNPKLPESLTTTDDGYQYVAPVGSYPPNGYGLYDMGGNAMEWVRDRYERNYFENSPLEDPQGPELGSSRVNKGGNFFASPADARCAFRGFSGPEMSFWNLSFRVVLEDMEDDGSVVAAKKEGSKKPKGSNDAAFPPSEEEGLAYFRQAMASAQEQQWDDAIEHLEAALKVYEKRQDYKWIARVKATLAGIYAERDRRYKSKELYTQALAEFRKIGDVNTARVILARLQDLETSPGVKVVEVKKGGAADAAGIVPEDVIIEYAGETGFRVRGFKELVEDYSRSSQVTLSVLNDGEISTMVVPGGPLGAAVEDIKRTPRPRRPRESTQRPRQERRPSRERRSRSRSRSRR